MIHLLDEKYVNPITIENKNTLIVKPYNDVSFL